MVLYLPPSHMRFRQESILNITKLGDRIRLFRIKQGISQKTLAERSGLAVTVLARYEQGKILDINPWMLQKLAKFLKTDPAELLPGSEQANNKDFLDYFCQPDTYGGRLRKMRLNRNLQQKDLAKMLGLHEVSVCRYEKDRSKPSKIITEKIDKILKPV